MKKVLMIMVTMGLLFGFFEATCAYADCPDYKIVCQDQTCHGWYGTCWSLRYGEGGKRYARDGKENE